MPSDPPRLVPDYPFPPYSYVPGYFPHPNSHPAGHSYRAAQEEFEPLDPDTWSQNHWYLVGIDLFNHGYYWEAHEVWEGLWKAIGRTGTTATFLKGLIKLAAAGVKRCERRARSTSHPRRAREHFMEVQARLPGGRTTFAGLSLDELISFARIAEGLTLVPLDLPAEAVELVYPFALRPQTSSEPTTAFFPD
jgi:hypothetical protein